jgi:transposase-like protein
MSKLNLPLSNDAYVAVRGNVCPHCSSDDITATTGLSAEGGSAWQDVVCNSCGKEWQDIYTLTGWE